MPHVTIFPKVNSVRLFPIDNTNAPQYNTRQFDSAAYVDSLEPYQTPIPYRQKVLFIDQLTVMVHTQSNDPMDPTFNTPVLKLFNSEMVPVDAVNPSIGVAPVNKGTIRAPFNNFTDPVSGVVTELVSTLWVFQLGDYLDPSADNGIYYLHLSNTDAFGNEAIFISDPILLFGVTADTFRDTKLIEASNDTNKAEVILDGWLDDYRPSFAIRVESDIREFEIKGAYIGMLQQDYQQLQLNAQSWRTWNLNIGTVSAGVPKQLWEMVAKFMECDNVRIDGKFFIFDNNNSGGGGGTAAWKVTDSQTKGLIHAKLPIRERWNSESAFVANIVDLFTSPGELVDGSWISAFPYAVSAVVLTDGITTVTVPAQVFYNADDEAQYLNYLQTTIKVDTYHLTGDFSFNDGEWKYSNGTYETYTGSVVFVLTKYFSFVLDINGPWGFLLRQSGFLNCNIVDWGDVDAWPYSVNQYRYFGTPSVHTQSHAYATGLFYKTVHVFHNDLFDYFGVTDYANAKMTTDPGGVNMDGVFPTELLTFAIQDQNFFGEPVNLPITMCPLLQQVSIRRSNVGGFSPEIFTTAYNDLTAISFDRNTLFSSDVDLVFNNFYNNSAFAHAGALFNIAVQTPSAPPTSASLTARTILAGAGWTILTD